MTETIAKTLFSKLAATESHPDAFRAGMKETRLAEWWFVKGTQSVKSGLDGVSSRENTNGISVHTEDEQRNQGLKDQRAFEKWWEEERDSVSEDRIEGIARTSWAAALAYRDEVQLSHAEIADRDWGI